MHYKTETDLHLEELRNEVNSYSKRIHDVAKEVLVAQKVHSILIDDFAIAAREELKSKKKN